MLASEAVDLAEQPIDFLGFGVDDVDKFGVFCLEVIDNGICTCLQGLYLIFVEFLQNCGEMFKACLILQIQKHKKKCNF